MEMNIPCMLAPVFSLSLLATVSSGYSLTTCPYQCLKHKRSQAWATFKPRSRTFFQMNLTLNLLRIDQRLSESTQNRELCVTTRFGGLVDDLPHRWVFLQPSIEVVVDCLSTSLNVPYIQKKWMPGKRQKESLLFCYLICYQRNIFYEASQRWVGERKSEVGFNLERVGSFLESRKNISASPQLGFQGWG